MYSSVCARELGKMNVLDRDRGVQLLNDKYARS